MARKTWKTRQNSIVIVCEGSETENQYFIEMSKYVQEKCPDSFDRILVLPTKKERAGKNPNRQHLVKSMQNPSAALWQYYLAKESSQAEYDKYRKQPTRYVREAQLLMRDEGYTEGWAVYDNDNFPDHDFARSLAAGGQGLHIAYSSFSVEEWILCHFERNATAYQRSECESKTCGIGVKPDCQGRECIAGRIRKQHYISDWSKSKPKVFETYTLPRLEQALVNAAWVRSLDPNTPIPQRNPYTDVDALVLRFLGRTDDIRWIKPGETFELFGGPITVFFDYRGVVVRYLGQSHIVIGMNTVQYCDYNGAPVQSASTASKILFANNNEEIIPVTQNARLLSFRNIEHGVIKIRYIEMPYK